MGKFGKRRHERKTQRETNRHAEQMQRLGNERARIYADSKPENFAEKEKTRRAISEHNMEIQKARAARSKSRNRAVAATGIAANTDVALDADVVSGGVGVDQPKPREPGPQPADSGSGTKPGQVKPLWATGPEDI